MGFFESGGTAAKFVNPGTTISGTITRPYREVQALKFGTQTPDVWPDGSPKMQAVIDLQTDQRDPAQTDDDGVRTLYVSSTKMKRAVADAIKRSGARDLEQGGTLTVTFTGYDQASKNPAQPAKLYSAEYSKPTGSLAPSANPWSTQSASAPAFTQEAAPAAAPATTPATAAPDPLDEKVRQLIGLGLTDDQIRSALGIETERISAIRA